MVKARCRFSQIKVIHGYFPRVECFCFFPANLMSSTYLNNNSPFPQYTQKNSQCGTFSHPFSKRTFSNYLSLNNPTKGWPYKFRSRGTTGSSILDHDFGHLCRGRRIQMSGHSDFGIFNNLWASSIFTWVCADTASAAWTCTHWQSGNDIPYHFQPSCVMLNDPCSVKTA